MLKFVFDIDGTICTNTNGNYELAMPIQERIDKINDLFEEGNIIALYTARGMGSTGNDGDLAKKKWEVLTNQQLELWGVKFHSLHFGKPAGDVYVDDKAISDGDFF